MDKYGTRFDRGYACVYDGYHSKYLVVVSPRLSRPIRAGAWLSHGMNVITIIIIRYTYIIVTTW